MSASRWFRVFAVAAAVVTTRTPAQPALEDRRILMDWLGGFRTLRSFEAEWEFRYPAIGGVPGEAWLIRRRTLVRWPDAFRDEDTPSRSSTQPPSPEEMGRWNSFRMMQGRITCRRPDGTLVNRDLDGGQFSTIENVPSLLERPSTTADKGTFLLAPYIEAHTDVLESLSSLKEPPAAVSFALRTDEGTVRFTLAPVEQGRPALTRIEKLGSDGHVTYRAEFRDYRPVAGLGVLVGHAAELSTAAGGDSLKPLGELVLRSIRVNPALTDDMFDVDLAGAVTIEASSGTMRNAAGDVVGRVPPRRRLGPWAQWATLIGAAGTGVVIVVAGWWWIRRRGA